MTVRTHTRRRRALAAAAALGLGLTGVALAAPAAHGADIDPAEPGSITIHKYSFPDDGAMNPDGTGALPTSDPLAGVVFEYCTIDGIDLFDGTNAGWDALNAITSAEKAAAADPGGLTLGPYTLSDCTELAPTDAAGMATTGTIDHAPYFVREVSAPSNVVTFSDPFIVTVPTPAVNPDVAGGTLDGEWVYDVHVYPKNGVAEGPRKNVVDQEENGALLGAPITFEVTQAIPALADGEEYETFRMTDTLDVRLDPIETSAVTLVDATDPATTFAAGTDFAAVWSGQTLVVELTATGLAKLVAGHNIVIGFQAAALELGEIENQAFVNINDLELTPGTPNTEDGSPTNVVQTRWGTVGIEKVNAADGSDGLAGAQFEVYMGTTETCLDLTLAEVTALAQVTGLDGSAYVAESNADGVVAISGLWVGDTEYEVAADGTVTDVNTPGHDLEARCYYLVETRAPNGFVLPAGDDAVTSVVITPGDNSALIGLSVPNTQQSVPELPFTGGDGPFLLMITGAALTVLTIGGVLLTRRRRHASESVASA